MQSAATNVDEYLLTVPEERQAALKQLRELCLKYLPGYTEVMAYGMPSYSKNEVVRLSFNSQKNYIALYIRKTVLDKYRASFKDTGGGCVRFKKPSEIDFTIVERMLQEVAGTDFS
jgi:uncharacterized protein YdhG (YjbR/CyaY superfamily)